MDLFLYQGPNEILVLPKALEIFFHELLISLFLSDQVSEKSAFLFKILTQNFSQLCRQKNEIAKM